MSPTNFLALLASNTFDSSGTMFSELSFGNDQHTALGVQKLASFALVFSWSMVLRPSLPILRVILAFSVVSLLFRSLLFSLLCRYCFPMVSFQSRSLSSHDRRVALLWHFGDGRLLGNPWDRTGTSQKARSIDFSNFLVGARRYPLAALWFALRFFWFLSCRGVFILLLEI